jgi:hypothetical protein
MHRPQYTLRRWLLATLTAAVLISTATAGPAAASGLGPDWVAKGAGEFTTKDRYDRVKYRIEHDAVDRSMVEFQLDADLGNWCLWGKTLVMPDGLSSEWPIDIDPSQGEFANSDRLWAGQVQNGQELRLYGAVALVLTGREPGRGRRDLAGAGGRAARRAIAVGWLLRSRRGAGRAP